LVACTVLLAGAFTAGYVAGDGKAQRTWGASARHKWAARVRSPDERHRPTRFQVDCRVVAASDPFVIAAFGQSNSANYGEQRYVPVGPVYDMKDGQCFLARDPLLNSDGDGGSVWTRLADRLIARGDAPAVALVSFGASGSEIARWAPGGDLNGRIAQRLAPLIAQGLSPHVVLFHQGESDAEVGTSAADYGERLDAVIASVRRVGVQAPFLVAVTSYCHGRSSQAVVAAQRAAVDLSRGIHGGADTDQLRGTALRFDDCHFSTAGMEKAADL
jgi:lysophospholipase L1-like esterase